MKINGLSSTTDQVNRLSRGVGSSTYKNKKLKNSTVKTIGSERLGVGELEVSSAGPTDQGGGGSSSIASPLTEPNYSNRTHYTERSVTSSDGIMLIRIKQVKKIEMTDANSSPVVFNFAEKV